MARPPSGYLALLHPSASGKPQKLPVVLFPSVKLSNPLLPHWMQVDSGGKNQSQVQGSCFFTEQPPPGKQKPHCCSPEHPQEALCRIWGAVTYLSSAIGAGYWLGWDHTSPSLFSPATAREDWSWAAAPSPHLCFTEFPGWE